SRRPRRSRPCRSDRPTPSHRCRCPGPRRSSTDTGRGNRTLRAAVLPGDTPFGASQPSGWLLSVSVAPGRRRVKRLRQARYSFWWLQLTERRYSLALTCAARAHGAAKECRQGRIMMKMLLSCSRTVLLAALAGGFAAAAVPGAAQQQTQAPAVNPAPPAQP